MHARLRVPGPRLVVVIALASGLLTGCTLPSSSLARRPVRASTHTSGATLGTTNRGLASMAIKVNPTDVDQIVADTGVMRHELTHYLLRRYSGSSPTWLTEGVATWIQYYPDDFARLQVPAGLYAQLMRADRALPALGLFNENPQVNYPIAQAAVTWLLSTYGVPRLIALMDAYRRHYAGVNTDALTSRVLRQVYGVSQAAVVRGTWQELARFQH